MAKKDFSLEEAVGRSTRHALAQLETHIGEYGGYYTKEGEKAQEISDKVKELFSNMMGYIGGNVTQLDVNYNWADKNVSGKNISSEDKLFEFTKSFAGAIGHELGYYDVSTETGKDQMRARVHSLIKAVTGLSDQEVDAKVKALIDSGGTDDDAINYIKSGLRAQQRADVINRAFVKYDINLTADEALQFSAALRAYEHEMSGRTIRKDHKLIAGSREQRLSEFNQMYGVLMHPQNSLYGGADREQRVSGQHKPVKYSPT